MVMPALNPSPTTTVASVLRAAVANSLSRDDVQAATDADVRDATPKVAADVLRALDQSPTTAVVEVKSPFASKVNWAQIAGPFASAAAGLLAAYGLHMTPEQIIAVVGAVQVLQSATTIVLKTFYTKAISYWSK